MYRITLLLILPMFLQAYAQEQQVVEPARFSVGMSNNIRDLAISNNGNEAYTTIQSSMGDVSVIVRMKMTDGKWQSAEIADFSGKYVDLEPFLSPDNLRLYFASNRPLEKNSEKLNDFDIWFVERNSEDAEWGDPVNVGSPVNSEGDEYYPAITNSGNLYFTCNCPGSDAKDDIYISRYTENGYLEPKPLGTSINSEGYEFNAYVSPDEDLLIFSGYGRPDGFGGGDLYFSVPDASGDWKSAVNFGQAINSSYLDFCPYYDASAETLYFTSRRSKLKSWEAVDSFMQLQSILGTYENGMSRLYKVKWKY